MKTKIFIGKVGSIAGEDKWHSLKIYLTDVRSRYLYEIDRKMVFIKREGLYLPVGTINDIFQRNNRTMCKIKQNEFTKKIVVGEYLYRIWRL